MGIILLSKKCVGIGRGGVGAVGVGKGVLEMVSNTFALFIRAHKT